MSSNHTRRIPGMRRLPIIAAVLGLAVSAAAMAADGPYLANFNNIDLVASTVPANGDVNPYGIVVIPNSVGKLQRGNVLVSNFNASSNLQGTGTTIMQIAPNGKMQLFAQIDASTLPASCPGGVGLTTALAVLRRGWVIVGSLPTTDGTSATAQAGCLLVLNSNGQVAAVWSGGSINGPWDMATLDLGDHAFLFVTNVLNGDVTSGAPHVVNQGTVVRLSLKVPKQANGVPENTGSTVIGSGYPETADPAALVIGPTGVRLGPGGTLYVADSLSNRIASIANAITRTDSSGTGQTVTEGGALNDPLGLLVAPNGDIITANGNDGNLVETAPCGTQVDIKTVETATGAGSLFGIVLVPDANGVYFVDDGDNTLKALTGDHSKD